MAQSGGARRAPLSMGLPAAPPAPCLGDVAPFSRPSPPLPYKPTPHRELADVVGEGQAALGGGGGARLRRPRRAGDGGPPVAQQPTLDVQRPGGRVGAGFGALVGVLGEDVHSQLLAQSAGRLRGAGRASPEAGVHVLQLAALPRQQRVHAPLRRLQVAEQHAGGDEDAHLAGGGVGVRGEQGRSFL